MKCLVCVRLYLDDRGLRRLLPLRHFLRRCNGYDQMDEVFYGLDCRGGAYRKRDDGECSTNSIGVGQAVVRHDPQIFDGAVGRGWT